MKIMFCAEKSGWSSGATVAFGASASIGKFISTRRADCPLLSGLHLSLGVLVMQFHLFIGSDAVDRVEPKFKFLRIEKL